jgi:hypothetical protein
MSDKKNSDLWPVPEQSQCQAKSKRTGRRCGNWREGGSKYCRFHGSRATGPRTPEGRRKAAAANLKHGRYDLASTRKNLLKTVLRVNKAAGVAVDKETLLRVWQMFQGLTYAQVKDRQKTLVDYLRTLSKDPQRDHRRRLVKLFIAAYEARNGSQPPTSTVHAFYERIKFWPADKLESLKIDLQKDFLKHLAQSKKGS